MSQAKVILSIVAAVVAAALFSATSGRIESSDQIACHTHDFKTELYKSACAKGGQREAKDAAKVFMKEKKIKSCNQCHSKLAPNYELKADGLEQFRKVGGK